MTALSLWSDSRLVFFMDKFSLESICYVSTFINLCLSLVSVIKVLLRAVFCPKSGVYAFFYWLISYLTPGLPLLVWLVVITWSTFTATLCFKVGLTSDRRCNSLFFKAFYILSSANSFASSIFSAILGGAFSFFTYFSCYYSCYSCFSSDFC